MKNSVKAILFKTLIVIGVVLELALVPGLFILSFFITDQEIFNIIAYSIIFSFFGVGGLVCVLLPFCKDVLQKSAKADKFVFMYNSYNEFMEYASRSFEKEGYKKRGVGVLNQKDNGTVMLYIKKTRQQELDCLCVIKISELSKDFLEKSNMILTQLLDEYYGGKPITDTINMISFFCVNRVTPTFYSLVNGKLQQGYKNGRMIIGISFGGKSVYVAKQKGGFGTFHYKKLYKTSMQLLQLTGAVNTGGSSAG